MSFSYFMGKQIIAWLEYDRFKPDDQYCYVYPKLLAIGNDEYEQIDQESFLEYFHREKEKNIAVKIARGNTAEEVCKSLGCKETGTLVSIRINKNIEESIYTSLLYNPSFGKTRSEIWIEPFSAKLFYQVFDMDWDIEQLQIDRQITVPQIPFANQYFLRNKNELIGPFELEAKEDSWELRGIKEKDYYVGTFDASEYDSDVYYIDAQGGELIIMPKSRINLTSCKDTYDWISEKRLIELVSSLFSKNANLSRDQTRKLDADIRNYLISAQDPSLSEARIHRILALVGKGENQSALPEIIVQYILADRELNRLIVDHIVENHFDDIKDRIAGHKQCIEDIDRLNADIKRLEEKKRGLLQEQNDKLKEQSMPEKTDLHSKEEVSQLQKTITKQNEEIEELKEQNEILEKEKDSYLQKSRIIDDIDALKKDLQECEIQQKVAKKLLEQQKADQEELEKTFNKKLSEFENRAQQAAKVIDDKLLKRILKGLGEDTKISSITEFDNKLLGEPMTAESIIERIGKFMREKAHRIVSDNDVANYLICLSQGFITTFAGEPGTGKTSLCNILAKSLGLSTEDNQNRFVDISVERGWTSIKDFIGYYNPLTKSMEKSNLEVFDAFEKMDGECGNAESPYNPSQYAPFIVLLDEANLSPIEHYWAAFLKNCDLDSASNHTISLGGNCKRSLPEHLRFLATVNFDHTTEELSPRFLDRSWVISLEPSNIDVESPDELGNYESMIDYGSIRDAFSVHEGEIESDGIRDKWEEIQRIFRDVSLPIMPRNLRMVRNYCLAACKCMDLERPSTRLAPIDYAFSQKILPTINGSGEKYEKLIDELLIACPEQSMPISNRHLKRMKEVAANNMGFYQFFAR